MQGAGALQPGWFIRHEHDDTLQTADASAFYQEQIPSLGWTLTGRPAITETAALLDFVQGNQTMAVIMTAGDGVTRVHIVPGKIQE